jgi:hypothetical protein
MFGDFAGTVRTLIYVGVIVIFWQCGLYTWTGAGGTKANVSAAQRLCLEIMGPALELRVSPPSAILSICSNILPSSFNREMATEQSSVLGIYRVVMRLHHSAKRLGFLQGVLQTWDWASLAALTEAAAWVRLIPSMLMFGPHTRGAAWSLWLLAIVAARPVPFGQLTLWFHVLVLLCTVDWYVAEGLKLQRSISRGGRHRRAALRLWIVDTIATLAGPPLIAGAIALGMVAVTVAVPQ